MAELLPSPLDGESPQEKFRWQGFFQHSPEPLFLLNRQRRLLFVNHAWENLTGLTLAEVRGRSCKRLAHPEEGEPGQAILAVLVPPAEVLEGRSGTARRQVAHGPHPGWWEMTYFP